MMKGKPVGRFYMGGSAVDLDQMRPMSELSQVVDAMTVEMDAALAATAAHRTPRLNTAAIWARRNRVGVVPRRT